MCITLIKPQLPHSKEVPGSVWIPSYKNMRTKRGVCMCGCEMDWLLKKFKFWMKIDDSVCALKKPNR